MSLWQIIFRSLRQHWLSSGLAILSIALGVALLISVISLREQSHRNFTQEGLGVDAVLGPKGSPLQIVLNALYHLEEMPGKIKWSYYAKVIKNPIVADGIPFATGHSYAGFRVNAIDGRFFTDFEYMLGKHFSFDHRDGGRGRAFQSRNEAVSGWAAAKALGIRLGDTFNPVCGVNAGDPVHVNDTITFTGIMAPTGTPHDRAIYIPLKTFYTIEGHGPEVSRMAVDENYREISGAYLKIKRIRGNAIHPGIQDLKYNINQSSSVQLVIPNEVLPRLFNIIGWVDHVLLAIAILVTLMAALFLFTALFSALHERRRDIALMRSLGAKRMTIFGLIIAESILITIFGSILGVCMGHGIVAIGSHFVNVETGLHFSAYYLSRADIFLMPSMLIMGLIAGYSPRFVHTN
ncbi:MAG: ABC transporter permease [Proteobacteria bacterium]|nr:ABC transporter permease [Pseudomonadota bacterium]